MLEDFETIDRRILYPVIAFFVVALIIALIIIWRPSYNKNLKENLNRVIYTGNYSDYQQNKYENILKELFRKSKVNDLYEHISKEWLDQNEIVNVEILSEYLKENGYITDNFITINSCDVFSSDANYLFNFSVNNNKGILVNEISPYNYEISFTDNGVINPLIGKEYSKENQDVTYIVKTKYVSDTVTQFEVTIDNKSDFTYACILKDFYMLALVMDDDTEVRASDVTSFGKHEITIDSGSSFTFDVTYNILLENQSKIKSFRLKNIYLGENNLIIDVNMK